MAAIRTRRIIDDAGAGAVLDAAENHAVARGRRVVMAVVDPWGELVAFRRTPGAQIASSRVALDKARTAAIFVRPSREIEEQVAGGRIGALALHGAAALIGGIPLKVDGETVGAIGTSGETPDEDEAVSIAGAQASYSCSQVPALTREGARLAAEAIAAEAARRGVAPVVCAVDAGGALMYLHRPDDSQVASVAVTTDKARTAAIYRRPSRDFENQAARARPSALHLARAVPLQGGEPIVWDGEVIGAVGVSGATTADEDRELALIGVAAARAAAAAGNGNGAAAAFFSAATVEERLREGGLLLDTPRYKIDAGRRVDLVARRVEQQAALAQALLD
ncbi:MAG TPA: heme-binding protein, partial [Solirubrobacteraceae bacterium]|nr:heme-binding protein [Solirubrobacteraceae bacterium]